MYISAHKSLADNYIQDYVRLTHEIYPSFITKINTNYYCLNLKASNINDDFQAFYKDITNPEHGGKYDIIYNLPVHLVTNSAIVNTAGEKGITNIESSRITCNIDAFINITPKEGDLIVFNNNINNSVIYRVINIETSSMLRKPYSKLNIEFVPNLNVDKMRNFIISERAFLTNYHYILGKGDALLIIDLQSKVDRYIEYFNEIYDHKIDGHVDNDHRVFLEFERAFNEMLDTYKQHTQLLKIHRSHLHDNLLSYYSDDNPFRRMLDPNSNHNDMENYLYTASIKRLDKTRRRTINNKIKIYRLISNSISDQNLITRNNGANAHNLTLPTSNLQIWDTIVNNEDFINNVKDQLSAFINTECNVISTDMFGNAIRLAQIFYIMERLIGTKIITRFTNLSYQFTKVN